VTHELELTVSRSLIRPRSRAHSIICGISKLPADTAHGLECRVTVQSYGTFPRAPRIDQRVANLYRAI